MAMGAKGRIQLTRSSLYHIDLMIVTDTGMNTNHAIKSKELLK